MAKKQKFWFGVQEMPSTKEKYWEESVKVANRKKLAKKRAKAKGTWTPRAPREAKYVGFNSSSSSDAPLFEAPTLNSARKKAIKANVPFVQIDRIGGGSVGRVNKNKKGAFWMTTNKAGNRATRFVVGKDGSLIGYSGQTVGKKLQKSLDKTDSWEYEPSSKFSFEDYFADE